jgi:TolA-binding protein
MSLNDVNFINGMIFVCDASTVEDMIKYQIFGLPSTYKREMKQLVPGESALFLLEKHTNFIKGIFVPTSTSKRLIVSNIWQRGELCAFPSQIKFGLFCRMPPFRKHSYVAPEFLKNMKCKGKFLDRKRTELLIQAFKENAYRLALEKHVFSAQVVQREAAADQYKRMVLASQQKQTNYNKMKNQISNLQDEIELLRSERFMYEVARDNLNEERLRLHDLKNKNAEAMPVTVRQTSHDQSVATTESAAGRTMSRSPVVDLAAKKKKLGDDSVNVLTESIERLGASTSASGSNSTSIAKSTPSMSKGSPSVPRVAEPHFAEHPPVEYNPYYENPSIDLSYPYVNEFDIPQARVIPPMRERMHKRAPMRYSPEYAPEVHYLAPTPGIPTAHPAYSQDYHYPLRVDSPFYPTSRSHLVQHHYQTHI